MRTLSVDGPRGEKIMRMNTVGSAPRHGEGPVDIRMHFMYGRHTEKGDVQVDMFAEDHTLGLFSPDTYISTLHELGVPEVWTEQPPEDLPYTRTLVMGRLACGAGRA